MAITASKEDRAPIINALSILEGEWESEASNLSWEEDKAKSVSGTASFRWMDEGHLMVYKTEAPGSPFPTGFAIIGFDEMLKPLQMLYTDSRGVSRIYSMQIDKTSWMLERHAPGFEQRFKGNISEDGKSIEGYWEKNEEDTGWTQDFDIRYKKR